MGCRGKAVESRGVERRLVGPGPPAHQVVDDRPCREWDGAMNRDQAACVLRVETPSRLHFGLLSFGQRGQRQFGGVGVMVDRPGVQLEFYASRRFETSGLLAERVASAARTWSDFYGLKVPPACAIHVARGRRQHTGLGVGTQTCLAVALGLHALRGEPRPAAAQLARSVGRGQRSAIGVYGFCEGGFIAERGKLPGESLSPLDCRLDLPEPWRWVLVCPAGQAAGLSGQDEAAAFAALPAMTPQTTAQLAEEVQMRMLPAAAQGDFAALSQSVFQYGYRAGSCFAAVQGGAYQGPQVAALVRIIRELGIHGVGQSSWGPTVFALTESSAAAEQLADNLRQQARPDEQLEIVIAQSDRQGARVVWNSQRSEETNHREPSGQDLRFPR
jgi:beta-ribofuranosylaminobenzene 5'-phosphate synthase